MTRSRKRKLQRMGARWATMPLASAALLAGSAAHAQGADTLEEVVVTAQKRSEDLQKVPISLTVLGNEKLTELQVSSFDDYAKFLPSLTYASLGPGQSQLYFRGTNSGGDGLHAGSLPTTGLYIDEIPATTVGNSLDLHVYDIARVEALAGPQGTLYGASSLAGTLRIITNKPDASKFSAGYDVSGNIISHGTAGGTVEGFVNLPIRDNLAVRLVGYYDHDGGWIDNTPFSYTYQRASDETNAVPFTRSNDTVVKNNVNKTDSAGGRVALKYDINDQWSILPQLIYQHQNANGNFGYDPTLGKYKTKDFFRGRNVDEWYQSALTVEGKVSNFDVLYSGGYFERKVNNLVDYTQYTIAYDQYGTGYSRFEDANGNFLDIDPSQYTKNRDKYTKMSHELRVTSPADQRLRGTVGAFYQRQTDNIRAAFTIDQLDDFNSVLANPTVLYLSQQDRIDRDYALFTELNFDVTESIKLTGGIRKFWVNNTLYGFFGYNLANGSLSGEASCAPDSGPSRKRPCVNTDKKVVENGETHKVNLQWQIDPDHMIYGTYSTGFRPGGNNRRVEVPAYGSDRIRNLEAGAKTSWFEQRLRLNGAVFFERWTGVQLGVQGLNGITSIYNIGDASMKGVEGDLSWLVTEGLTLSLGGTYVDAKTKTNFCAPDRATGAIVTDCVTPLAPEGSRLPGVPKYKGNAIARYKFTTGEFTNFLQGAAIYQSNSVYDLGADRNAVVGKIGGYVSFDFSAGTGRDNWSLEGYVQNAFDRNGNLFRIAQCATSYCDEHSYSYSIKPMSVGIRFGQKF